MVQLNSNLTLIFDHSRVFTDFIRVSDKRSRVFYQLLVWCHEFDSQLVETESPYEPPYESRRGNTRTRLDSWNTRFPIKVSLYIDININKQVQNGGVPWVTNFRVLSRYMHYIAN